MKNITKAQITDYVRFQLKNNKAWAYKALTKIYDKQTLDEQQNHSTCHSNNVGFTGADADILSSFAKQLLRRGSLSPKQDRILFSKIHKYSRQIIEISDQNILKAQTRKFLLK